MRIEIVDTAKCDSGEGPLWDVASQALYFIDNVGRQLHRYTPGEGCTDSWNMPAVITAFAIREKGGAVVTLRTGIHLLNLETGKLAPLHLFPDPPHQVLNDGKVDRAGRFFIGASTAKGATPTNEGGLFRLDPDHALVQLDDDIHFSNGPCWAPDNRTFYFADSWRHTIYAYDFDLASGSVSDRRPFVDTRALNGLPDGATVDSHGLLWVALYGAGLVAAYRPDGQIERTVEMPVKLVSSVSFGGPELDRLFVTSIAHDRSGRSVEAEAGHVFVVDGLDVTGLPEPRYAG